MRRSDMSEKKVRQHKLTDKNPVVSSILFGVLGFLALQILTAVINGIISIFVKGYPMDVGPVGTVVATWLFLLAYKKWFKPEYLGSIKGGEYNSVWVVVAIYAVFLIITFITDRLFSGERAALPALSNVFLSLLAGATEEAAFRGFMVPVLMRKHGKKSLMIPILVPAVVFALVHGLNGLMGAQAGTTALQVIACIFYGAAYAVIFLISGNILIPIAVHFVHDVVAFSYEGAAETGGVMAGGITVDRIVALVAALIMFLIVMYFVTRPKNTEKVLDIWKRKWELNE